MPDNAPPPCDVLCVGLVCVDVILSVPHHPATDEKLRAGSRLVAPGGPAAVAAAQIARLGGRVAFAGLVGEEPADLFAPLLRRAFAHEGIDTTSLISAAGFETPLAAILVKPDATRAVVSHRPPPPSAVNEGVTQRGAPEFPPARVLLTDGHRPEWNGSLLARAGGDRTPLVLDAGSWSDSVRALAREADHVVASEACARTALDGAAPASAPPAALRAALGVREEATVVVTLGERGLVWSTPTESGARPAFPIASVDTTGAGDAFHGAYALGLARALPFAEILRQASAAGALACTRPGAWPALASAAEIDAFLALPS